MGINAIVRKNILIEQIPLAIDLNNIGLERFFLQKNIQASIAKPCKRCQSLLADVLYLPLHLWRQAQLLHGHGSVI